MSTERPEYLTEEQAAAMVRTASRLIVIHEQISVEFRRLFPLLDIESIDAMVHLALFPVEHLLAEIEGLEARLRREQ